MPKGLKRWSNQKNDPRKPGTYGCYEFKYAGCGGTANNFKTKEDCEKLCNPPPGA